MVAFADLPKLGNHQSREIMDPLLGRVDCTLGLPLKAEAREATARLDGARALTSTSRWYIMHVRILGMTAAEVTVQAKAWTENSHRGSQ